MKLTAFIETVRSGSLPFSAEWTDTGWTMSFVQNTWKSNPDGTPADGERRSGFRHWMINEVVYLPDDHEIYWRELWEAIQSKTATADHAKASFLAYAGWINAVTRTYPGDPKIYPHDYEQRD